MRKQTMVPNAMSPAGGQGYARWSLLAQTLGLLLVLAVAAWPVLLETCAPSCFTENLAVYRAAHRHFRQKNLIELAMQCARDATILTVNAGSAGRLRNPHDT